MSDSYKKRMDREWKILTGANKYIKNKTCNKCGSNQFYKTGNCVACTKRKGIKKEDKKIKMETGYTRRELQERRWRIEESQQSKKTYSIDGYDSDF